MAELESLNDSIIDSVEHKDKISSDVAQFVCSFNDIIDIQNNYPVIFSLFPDHKKTINYWEMRLSEQYDTFGAEMEQALLEKNFPALKNKILITKSLRGLDFYLTGQKSYRQLCNQYNGKFTTETDQIKTELEKNLQDFEYRKAEDNFERLESLGIKEVRYKNSLWELKELTIDRIEKFIILTLEEADSIRKKLETIENYFKYMGKYIKEEITRETIFGEIRLILDEKVKGFTDGIDGLFHAYKFTEGENELYKINVIKQLLGKYISSEKVTSIEELIINKNAFITKVLVEYFSNLDNLHFIGDELRQLLIRLHDAKEKSTCEIYNKAYRDINSKLVSNFKDRLEKASQTSRELQNHLPKLKQVLNALPCDLKTILNEEIEAVLQKVDFTKEFNFGSPENKIVSDLEGIKVIQNVCSALVLDVPGQSNNEGARIWQYKSNKTKAQHFEISKIKDKEYYQIKACCSGLFLDVASASNQEDGVVWQWGWNGTFAQLWKIEPAEYGYYTIINVGSGLLLSIKEDSEKAELAVVQQKDSGSYRHKWKLVLLADI